MQQNHGINPSAASNQHLLLRSTLKFAPGNNHVLFLFHKDAKIHPKYFITLWFFVLLERTNGMKKFVLGSIFCLFAAGALAQSKTSPLYFQSGTLQPIEFDAWNTPWTPSEKKAGKGIRIIQFDAIPTQEKMKWLQSQGIQILDYMPEKAYFAEIPTTIDFTILRQNGVVAILGINLSMKQSKELVTEEYPNGP